MNQLDKVLGYQILRHNSFLQGIIQVSLCQFKDNSSLMGKLNSLPAFQEVGISLQGKAVINLLQQDTYILFHMAFAKLGNLRNSNQQDKER